MTIAIHITSEKKDGYLFKLKKRLFKLLAEKHPDDHFIFIMDDPNTAIGILPPNCTPAFLGPLVRNKLMRRYWYDLKLPSLIQRYNADVFIPAGIYLSARTKCRQVLLLDELTLTKAPKTKEMKATLSGASFILCTTEPAEEILIKKFDTNIGRLKCIYPGQDEGYTVRTHEENEQIREEFTSGNHYFLARITAANEECFLPLMKAFSIFKKFQKSGMMMMLVSEGSVTEKINLLLSNYKFRNDVIHSPLTNQLQKITAAAYAVFILDKENIQAGINAIASGIPVVIENAKEFGDAALNSGCSDASLAEKMMTLYKDEHKYYELVQNGMQLMEKYSWEKAIADTWNSING